MDFLPTVLLQYRKFFSIFIIPSVTQGFRLVQHGDIIMAFTIGLLTEVGSCLLLSLSYIYLSVFVELLGVVLLNHTFELYLLILL